MGGGGGLLFLATPYSCDISTPRGLQQKVWVDIMLFFIRRGRENLRQMTKTLLKSRLMLLANVMLHKLSKKWTKTIGKTLIETPQSKRVGCTRT